MSLVAQEVSESPVATANVAGVIVIEQATEWVIAVGEATERLARDVAPEELAVCVDLMVRMSGLRNPDGILAPHSTSCFFSRLDLGEDVELRDRAALRFELESHLPLDAESMVADFQPLAAGNRRAVSAVALPLERWQRIADALESVGVTVRSIVPAAILASSAVCEASDSPADFEILLIEGNRGDWLAFREQGLAGWKHVAISHSALQRQRLLDQAGQGSLLVVGATGEQRPEIALSFPNAELRGDGAEGLMIQGAAQMLAHPSARQFDLRPRRTGSS